jgi:hypothetical protein
VGYSFRWCLANASIVQKEHKKALWVVHAPDGQSWQLDKVNVPSDSNATTVMKLRLKRDDVVFDSRTALAYDGSSRVFVSDYVNSTVHCWSINGVYIGRILSNVDIQKPCCLAVDEIKGRNLFVAQEDGVMKVFDL